MIRVSAGIVRRTDGRILICQRGEGRHNAHLWEFPGGKQEDSETAAECLARELMEELSLPIQHVETLCCQEAEGILFTFLTAQTEAEPTLTEHERYAFVQAREMLGYDFCPADTAVARRLALTEPPLKHFFWDFDGTLMDTYPGMVKAFVRAAASMGIEAEAGRVMDLMKENLGHCCRVLAAEHGRDADELLRAFRREEAAIDLDDIQPLPGIPECLRALMVRGGKHYVATHRDHTAVEYLNHAGLTELFAGGVYAENGLPRKPAPDMLLHLMKVHGLKAEECAMIGDRPLDIASGRNAGVLTCLIDTEGRFGDTVCDLRTDTAMGLERLLRGG